MNILEKFREEKRKKQSLHFSGGIIIDVPFTHKPIAKKLGARWSPEQKSWYIPKFHTNPQLFNRWTAINNVNLIKRVIPTYEIELYGEVLKGTEDHGWENKYGNRCWSCKAIHRSYSIFNGLAVWYKEPISEAYLLRPDAFVSDFTVTEDEGNCIKVVKVDSYL